MSQLTYQQVWQQSIESPDDFWQQAAKLIDWKESPTQILQRQDNQDDSPGYRWFSDGKLNTCYNAVDRHVRAGFGDQAAIIYDSPVTNTQQTISYQELQQRVAKTAGAIQKFGVVKGDTVIIYMPMIPEAIIGMLACARLGAIHSVVFGGFAANELATRIDDAKPKIILSASCGIEPTRIIDYKTLLEEANKLATHKIQATIIKQRSQQPCQLTPNFDYNWDQIEADSPAVDCEVMQATDPLYVLYTSGTTGQPKGIVRDNGGHAVAMQWSMQNLYNASPGDVYWAASDVGWIVGHSYIVYAPLLNRNTTVIFEGKPVGTPDAGAFWRVIEQYQVKILFTAPTAFRAIKKEDPKGELIQQYNIESLQSLFLAGERSDPDTIRWSENHLKVPVIDHWWQTETSWAIACNPLGIEQLPVKIGSATVAVPGYQIEVLDEDGNPQVTGELGNIVIKLPLPPGTLVTLWGNHQRFIDAYLSKYPGYYLTGDSGIIDEDGYIHIMSRIDDVINVAGHRLSTGQMEEILCEHPDVAEAAVFGVHDDLKGEVPLGLVVCNVNTTQSQDEICQQLRQKVRQQLGALAVFKLVAVISRLPKTRSGKILRATMRKIANQEEWKMPATIDDPTILDEVGEAIAQLMADKK